jgi:preprotein translocase SecE subunit
MALQTERLKNQQMSGGAAESRIGAFVERVREYPRRFRAYLHDVRVELHHVTWPTRHEVVVRTFVVIVAVTFFGIYFFGVDTVVGSLIERLLTRFGRP